MERRVVSAKENENENGNEGGEERITHMLRHIRTSIHTLLGLQRKRLIPLEVLRAMNTTPVPMRIHDPADEVPIIDPRDVGVGEGAGTWRDTRGRGDTWGLHVVRGLLVERGGLGVRGSGIDDGGGICSHDGEDSLEFELHGDDGVAATRALEMRIRRGD